MELSWLIKLRIAAVIAAGGLLIGFFGWSLAAPADPFMPVLLSSMNLGGAITLGIVAAGVGLLAYFLSWPYGRQISVLAVPAGLAVWALRCGTIGNIIQINPGMDQRQQIFAGLKWEPVFWLAVVAAGFAGVLLGQKILAEPAAGQSREESKSKSNIYLNAIIALIGSGFIAQLCLGVFAQDARFDSVVAQPTNRQIAFAVLASFAIPAFIFKKFLNAGYIWSVIATVFVTVFAIAGYVKEDVLQNLTVRYPAVFFSNAIASILPLQMVAFGVLGSIIGYWLAVRYDYWQKHMLK